MRITNTALFEHGNYTIIAQSYETSTGWGHIAILKHNDRPLDTLQTNKIRYYNRTWERYRYQSAILGALYMQIESIKDRIIYNYKIKSGKTRLTQAQKDELLKDNDEIKELQEIRHYFADEYHNQWL